MGRLVEDACIECGCRAAMRCAKCHWAKYCNTECQRAHWTKHACHCANASTKPWAFGVLLESLVADSATVGALIGPPLKRGREDDDEDRAGSAKKRATEPCQTSSDVRSACSYLGELTRRVYEFMTGWNWSMMLSTKTGLFDAQTLLDSLAAYSAATVETIADAASGVLSLAWRLFEYLKRLMYPSQTEGDDPMETTDMPTTLPEGAQAMDAAAGEFDTASKSPHTSALAWIVNYVKSWLERIATMVNDALTVAVVKVGEIIGSVFRAIPKTAYGVVQTGATQEAAYHFLRLALFTASIMDNAPALVRGGVELLADKLKKLKDPLMEIIEPVIANLRTWWKDSEILRGANAKIEWGLTWASALPAVKALGKAVSGIKWVLEWFVAVVDKIREYQKVVVGFVYSMARNTSKRMLKIVSRHVQFPSLTETPNPRAAEYQDVMDAGDVVITLGEKGELDTATTAALTEKRALIRAAFGEQDASISPAEKEYASTVDIVSLAWNASAVAARGIVSHDYDRRAEDVQFNRYVDVTKTVDDSAQGGLAEYLELVKGAANTLGARIRGVVPMVGVKIADVERCVAETLAEKSREHHEWWLNVDAARALAVTYDVKVSKAFALLKVAHRVVIYTRPRWLPVTIALSTCIFTVAVLAKHMQRWREDERIERANKWMKEKGNDTVVFEALHDRGTAKDLYAETSKVQTLYQIRVSSFIRAAKGRRELLGEFNAGDRTKLNDFAVDMYKDADPQRALPKLPIPPQGILNPTDRLTDKQVQLIEFDSLAETEQPAKPSWWRRSEKPARIDSGEAPYQLPPGGHDPHLEPVRAIGTGDLPLEKDKGGAVIPRSSAEITTYRLDDAAPVASAEQLASEIAGYNTQLDMLEMDIIFILNEEFESFNHDIARALDSLDYRTALKNAFMRTMWNPLFDIIDWHSGVDKLANYYVGGVLWGIGAVNIMYTISCALLNLEKVVTGVGVSKVATTMVSSAATMFTGIGLQYKATHQTEMDIITWMSGPISEFVQERIPSSFTTGMVLGGFSTLITWKKAEETYLTYAKRRIRNLIFPRLFDETSEFQDRDMVAEIRTIADEAEEDCTERLAREEEETAARNAPPPRRSTRNRRVTMPIAALCTDVMSSGDLWNLLT